MSLRVWLPLNGDLTNQGLENITVTNNGATVDNNGKIGKCYSFDGTNDYLTCNYYLNGLSEFSIAFWYYINNATSINTAFLYRGSGAHRVKITGGDFTFRDTTHSDQYSVHFSAITASTWVHVCVVYKEGSVFLYKNGVLDNSYINNTKSKMLSDLNEFRIARIQSSSNDNYLNGKLNDFRIYDHALSQKEVKEISKGLVCHYKLDSDSIQTLNNCYNYPTFNTSDSTGGWNHWGGSGHKGTYGQNTDSQYIFKDGQTYSHWIQDDSGATKNYLLYQSPAFDGGYRSLQCILKESSGLPINENIIYPTWNAPTGTHTNKWDSIQSLGNGFYLCKCEGLQQDGSNDLAGLYVKPPYRVYISECYLENNKTNCSDIFYPSTTIYDSSGYNYHGIPSGNLTISSDTARNSLSTVFDGTSTTRIELNDGFPLETKSVSIWVKTSYDTVSSSQVVFHDKNTGLALGFYTNNRLITYTNSSGSGGTGSCVLTTNKYIANQWNHIVIIKTGDNTRDVYVNGEKMTATTNNMWTVNTNKLIIGNRYNSAYNASFSGQISDFRAYSTALSADDVKELYQLGASIDKNGNMFAYEFKED